MNEESITIRVLVTLQSSILMPTVCSAVFCSNQSVHFSVQASPSSNTNVQSCGSLKCRSEIGSFLIGSRDQSHDPVHTRDQAKYCWDQSLRLVPRIQTSLNSWDRFRGPKFSPCDRIFDENWPVHTMGLGRRDWSLRPVPATSPLVCGDLYDA